MSTVTQGLWRRSDLPHSDTLNLQQSLRTWSCSLGLGWNWALLCHKGVLGRANKGRKQFLHNGTQILLAGECPIRSLSRLILVACGLWQLWWDGGGTVHILLQRQCLCLLSYKVSEESRPLAWFCEVTRSWEEIERGGCISTLLFFIM